MVCRRGVPLLFALAACSQTHSAGPGGAASRVDGGGAGSSAAPDGQRPGELPEARLLGESEPLREPPALAFIAGYHADEQVFLLGEDGALERISTWETKPAYTDSCGSVWSTAGYPQGSGRFGRLHATPDDAYLLFSEQLGCDRDRDVQRYRLIGHHVASGRTSVLAETAARPTIVSGNDTVIALVRYGERMQPPQPLAREDLRLFVYDGGALHAADVPSGDDWLQVASSDGMLVARWRERTVVAIDGVPALERADGDERFVRSELLQPFGEDALWLLRGSPSGERMCAITERRVLDVEPETKGWLLLPGGRWESVAIDRNTFQCFFSPDETRVMFGTRVYDVEPDGLGAVSTADPLPAGSVPWRDGVYARDESGVERFDWETFASETQLQAESLASACGPSFGPPRLRGPELRVPPDDRALAVLKLDCGCTDCDVSSSFAWNVESGRVETIETVAGEHEVYGVAWLGDGGAAVLSTQRVQMEDGTTELRPSRGSYFRVDADGTVETIALRGVNAVMHSPLGL